jgi:hypothetical protein
MEHLSNYSNSNTVTRLRSEALTSLLLTWDYSLLVDKAFNKVPLTVEMELSWTAQEFVHSSTRGKPAPS